ncbi:sn-glycerol-1-phosphate dehydrogenase [Dysgonomonas sp. 511]|uniref:sn-glycerol-1-phosphate dehydrogenase n=1 Tax=Dysgonomonas sp. 511 TaxID=2302930 RepID=UPI0013D8CF7C|nr:sn-glycerol-1-phosphate dehydrogenase [Dysgonomonas sp. 511]NDV78278.1 sn-glycerol-1-phosphate dehydrogenase [Dysgonomonas sp. 511]
MSKIEQALKAADETKALEIGFGILKRVAELFSTQFPGSKAVVVADENTFGVAGKEVVKILASAGIEMEAPFIFSDPELYAEYKYVEILEDSLKTHNAIPIAVGSGTINDLTKLASHLAGRRYLCVATAASMDGYTAFGASITANGAKQTFSCPAPIACLADIDIIRQAPPEMTASGYADLFAKVTAGADWILADSLRVEPIDKQAWDIVQNGLHDALFSPKAVSEGDREAIYNLTEGLMLGGFAMQWSKSSRPASGAEHQFSHLWNMEHHTNEGEQISHGFQVAIGTLSITALYEVMLNTPMEDLDIKACCDAWPTAEELDKEATEIFRNTDFPKIGEQETLAKYISKEELAGQLQSLKDNWTEIKEKLSKQLVPYNQVKEYLGMVGAPTDPEDIGVSREYLKQTFIRAQYIRRRFTILDVAVRTNMLDRWLDVLFGEKGLWEIKKKTAAEI